MNKYVLNAISNTEKYFKNYLESALKQRLNGGAGSCYEQFEDTHSLLEAIKGAEWIETTYPTVNSDCKLFKAKLPGRIGLININELSDDAILIADDRKNTGYISITVKGERGRVIDESYLIIGYENINDIQLPIVYTFHPGKPIAPSNISNEIIKDGTELSKQEAINLGFDIAKII